jgi:hypothetical protein
MIPHSLTVLQYWQGSWAQATFPMQTNGSILEHLRREVKELQDSDDPQEAADCLLLLLAYAHRNGFDLFSEAVKKFHINQERQWGEPDAHGVVEHVRS